jgi:hypothetical protein
LVEGDVAGVEPEQAAAGVGVGERDLQGEVDAAGPGGKRRLDEVGPVRREDEQQVGVLLEALHLVEQFEQDAAADAVLHGALAGHQVDVLEDDGGGRELARDADGLLDEAQTAAREQDGGAPGHRAQQVGHRQRLAGARRAVEQDAALEVTSGRAQPLGLAGHADRLALEALERAVGQDHRVAGDLGDVVELHGDRLVLVLVQRDDVAAVDVVLAHRRPKLAEQGGDGVGLG